MALTKLKVTFFIAIIISPFIIKAQQENGLPNPVVDTRVELLSIVFRLAGNQEYNSDRNKNYVQEIHDYFDKFASHPLIKFAKQLHDENGVSYDQVMSMAIFIKQPPELDPIVPFSDQLPNERFSKANALKFVELLKHFYKDADCETFFNTHKDYYARATEGYNVLFKKLDVNWYFKYYGKQPTEKYQIVIGLGNGGANYGPAIDLPNHSRIVYAIIGAYNFDDHQIPIFSESYDLPTLIHEFNHSFVNYLTDKYEVQLKNAGITIYSLDSIKMKRQAYGTWQDMLSEALVRASVIQYLNNHYTDTSVADRELKEQLAEGFVWIRGLVDLLSKYKSKRDVYPTLESFMPEVVKFYAEVALNYNKLNDDFEKLRPKVISLIPDINGLENVSSTLTELKINFSEPMGKGISIFLGEGGKAHYPITDVMGFSEDSKSYKVKLSLVSGKTYDFVLTGRGFKSKTGYPLQTYAVHFKVK